MIILDTHIWIWLVDKNSKLNQRQQELIKAHQSDGLGISIISCWEVAKLVENNKLTLSCSVDEWLQGGLGYPGIQLLPLTLPIIVVSTQLTDFHRDPADQLIVATAKVYDCPLLTVDSKILAYSQVKLLS